MKKNIVKILICLLLATLLCVVLVACNQGGQPLPDGWHHVTFNYNYDASLTDSRPGLQYLGVKDGALVGLRPDESNTNFPELAVNGFYLEGWYEAKYDADGNPIVGENGVVELERKWDFEEDRVYKDITLYANMQKKPYIRFIEVDEDGVVLDADGQPNEVGSIEGDRPDTVWPSKPSGSYAPRKTGYTFLGNYYLDAECTQLFDWTYEETNYRGETVVRTGYKFGEEDFVLYVKFVEGTWSIVSTEQQLKTALNTGASIYLMNDIELAEEQDNSGEWKSNWTPYNYNGTFNGNGHTISNIHVVKEATRREDSNYGIFGTLGARANIYDLTIAESTVKITYIETGAPIEAGFFAWKMESTAKLTNVNVSGDFIFAFSKTDDINRIAPHEFIGNATQEMLESFATNGCSWTVSVTRTVGGEVLE